MVGHYSEHGHIILITCLGEVSLQPLGLQHPLPSAQTYNNCGRYHSHHRCGLHPLCSWPLAHNSLSCPYHGATTFRCQLEHGGLEVPSPFYIYFIQVSRCSMVKWSLLPEEITSSSFVDGSMHSLQPLRWHITSLTMSYAMSRNVSINKIVQWYC